jgi:hypothetical protein
LYLLDLLAHVAIPSGTGKVGLNWSDMAMISHAVKQLAKPEHDLNG